MTQPDQTPEQQNGVDPGIVITRVGQEIGAQLGQQLGALTAQLVLKDSELTAAHKRIQELEEVQRNVIVPEPRSAPTPPQPPAEAGR